MLLTTRAIVLRTIRHGDRGVVVQAYTERSGRRAYYTRISGKAGITSAVFHPLNRLEIVVTEDPEKELHHLKEARVEVPFDHIPRDPLRGTVLLFLQELLLRTLREGPADEGLFVFLWNACTVLDHTEHLAEFPAVLLLQYSMHLGFYPEAPRPGAEQFDLREGCFTSSAAGSGHVLPPPQAAVIADLMKADLLHLDRMPHSAQQRRKAVDDLLLYFRLHLDGMGELRSPKVLHQVLS